MVQILTSKAQLSNRFPSREPVVLTGARLCPKDQPQRVARERRLNCGVLRLVLQTQPRSIQTAFRRHQNIRSLPSRFGYERGVQSASKSKCGENLSSCSARVVGNGGPSGSQSK